MTPFSSAKMLYGKSIIQYPLLAKAFGVLAVGVSILLIVVAIHAPSNERALALTVCGTISLLLLALPLEFFSRRVLFDSQKIEIFSVWGKHRVVAWDEVVSFDFFPEKREWHLVTQSDGTIKPSFFLTGLDDLLAVAQSKEKSNTGTLL